MGEFIYTSHTVFTGDQNLDYYLEWWAEKTKHEDRMLTRTPEFFKENLIYASFVFAGSQIIGAAGLIPCLNRNKEHMYYQDKLVVEFGSNFVLPEFQRRHIGRELILKRLEFSKANNYFPVSVTGHIAIKKDFQFVGGQEMEKFPEFDVIRNEVRVCECESKHCLICPLAGKAIWVFPEYI